MLRSYKIVLLFAASLTACETVVDVDIPDEPPRLVVNAFLQADSAVVLELSQSQSILSNAPLRPVGGATAVLLEGDQLVTTLEEIPESGTYFSDFTPSVGKSYTIQVSKAGFEAVEATTLVRSPVAIQAIEVDTTLLLYTYDNGDSIVTERNVTIDEVRLTFDDPASERNYYAVMAYRYQIYWQEIYDAQNRYVRTDTVRGLIPLYLRSDDSALTGAGDDFLSGDDVAYGQTLSFSDDFFNGKTYTFQFRPDYYSYYEQSDEENEIYITLRTIDEGQYRYFRSVDLQYENDGNPFAEPVQVYSNVENGFGIVSGSSASQVVVNFE